MTSLLSTTSSRGVGNREGDAELLSLVSSDRIQWKDLKLDHGKFGLNIWKILGR